MESAIKALKNPGYIGFVYALLSVFFMSPVFIVASIVTKEIPAETANFMFFLSGLLVTSLISTVRGKNGHVLRLAKNHFRPLFQLGALNAAAAILFFTGIKAIGPSTSAFVSRSETVFTILLGVLVLKEKLHKADMFGITLAVVGTFMMTYSDVSVASGSLLILASSFIISFQRVLLAKFVSKIDPFELNQLRLLFGTSILLVYVAVTSKLLMPPVNSLFLIALGGISAPVIGFYFFLKSMKFIGISKVTTVASIQPIVVAVMSVVLLGSSLSPGQIFGGGLMIVGVIILAVAHGRHALKTKAATITVD